jgi:DedD protein
MAVSADTEITLGTGKVLAFFFGLVLLCAVFFGMGFSLGKNSARSTVDDLLPASPSPGGMRPSAVRSTSASPSDVTFYKAVGQKATDARSTADSASNTAGSGDASSDSPADPTAAPPLNGYYVQVAAVSKREDAEALVAALKKKQFSAFAATVAMDKLFHVQVGPFANIKDAESTRAKLVSDGYNPILKK